VGAADSKPLISVIVPVYNTEKFLHTCLDSILAQTYKNLEIILVNDGSSDMCPMICDEYADKDSRVTVIHKKNGGLSSARNAGLDSCSGEYITFVDSDDIISECWIEKLQDAIHGKDFIIAGITYVENDNYTENLPEDESILSLINSSLFGYCCNKLYRRETIVCQRFLKIQREDIVYNLQLIAKGYEFAIVKYSGYRYIQRKNSLLHTVSVPDNSVIFQFEKELSAILDSIREPEQSEIYNRVLYSYLTDHIVKLVRSEKYTRRKKITRIKDIISYAPLSGRLLTKYADNTLYKIFIWGLKMKNATMIALGYQVCQRL